MHFLFFEKKCLLRFFGGVMKVFFSGHREQLSPRLRYGHCLDQLFPAIQGRLMKSGTFWVREFAKRGLYRRFCSTPTPQTPEIATEKYQIDRVQEHVLIPANQHRGEPQGTLEKKRFRRGRAENSLCCVRFDLTEHTQIYSMPSLTKSSGYAFLASVPAFCGIFPFPQEQRTRTAYVDTALRSIKYGPSPTDRRDLKREHVDLHRLEQSKPYCLLYFITAEKNPLLSCALGPCSLERAERPQPHPHARYPVAPLYVLHARKQMHKLPYENARKIQQERTGLRHGSRPSGGQGKLQSYMTKRKPVFRVSESLMQKNGPACS